MFRNLLAAGATLLAATSAQATTYFGSATAGTTSATYSITTDGTLGVLSTGNITGVSGTVTSATQSNSFSNGNFVNIIGGALSASATQITFDNSLQGGFAFGDFGAVFPVICFAGEASGVSCNGEAHPDVLIGANFPNDFTTTTSSGTIVVASIGGVPEPAAWAMMLGGFGIAGAAVRRRRNVVRVTYA